MSDQDLEKTLRTDEQAQLLFKRYHISETVPSHFARTLERENNQLRKRNEELLESIGELNSYDAPAEVQELRQKLTTTEARLAEAIVILKSLKDYWNCETETIGFPYRQVCDFLSSTEPPAILKELEKAKSALQRSGYTWEGGNSEWMPPVNHKFREVYLRAESAEAKLAEAEKDKARLDFLANKIIAAPTEFTTYKITREAIDDAIKQTT